MVIERMRAPPSLGRNIKRLRKDLFNGSINNGNVHLKYFNGTNIRQLNNITELLTE